MKRLARSLAFLTVVVVAVVLSLASLLFAQGSNASTVTGTIADTSVAVASAVAVTLRNLDTG
jgi:hypothetical protein